MPPHTFLASNYHTPSASSWPLAQGGVSIGGKLEVVRINHSYEELEYDTASKPEKHGSEILRILRMTSSFYLYGSMGAIGYSALN